MDTITLTPGTEYEVVIRDDDPKAPGKVYAGEFHHQDSFVLVLVVPDRTAKRNVVDLTESGDPDARVVAGTERDGYRMFGIPQSRIGEVREPGKKGVKRRPTTPAETGAE